jgi:hypothetical protein
MNNLNTNSPDEVNPTAAHVPVVVDDLSNKLLAPAESRALNLASQISNEWTALEGLNAALEYALERIR